MDATQLTASYYTLTGAPPGHAPRFPLTERAAAAKAAGFTGLALAPDELRIARAAGLDAGDLGAELDRIGIAVTDLEPLRGWDGEDGAREDEEAMFALADACGTTRLTAIQVVGDDVPAATVAARFAGVCDRAAAHGLTVAFEPRASSPIETPAATAALFERAGRPNVGMIVDHYHAHRGGWGAAEVIAAGVPIVAIHLNDTTAVPLDSPLADALENRLAPGEGDLDVPSWIASLTAAGISAPFAVEVLSAAFRELPLDEAAARAFTGAHSALTAA